MHNHRKVGEKQRVACRCLPPENFFIESFGWTSGKHFCAVYLNIFLNYSWEFSRWLLAIEWLQIDCLILYMEALQTFLRNGSFYSKAFSAQQFFASTALNYQSKLGRLFCSGLQIIAIVNSLLVYCTMIRLKFITFFDALFL